MQFRGNFLGGKSLENCPKDFTEGTSSLKVSFPKLTLDFFTQRLNSSNIVDVEITRILKAITKEQEFETQGGKGLISVGMGRC